MLLEFAVGVRSEAKEGRQIITNTNDVDTAAAFLVSHVTSVNSRPLIPIYTVSFRR